MGGLFALLLILVIDSVGLASTTQQKFDRTAVSISGSSTLTPGEYQIALHITTIDEWHTYWVNPGDSGAPTELSWSDSVRPEGPLLYPTPERIPGVLQTIGYHHGLTLKQNILWHQPTKPLQVEIDWLVCKEACYPYSARLVVDSPEQLPVTETPQNPETYPQNLKVKALISEKDVTLHHPDHLVFSDLFFLSNQHFSNAPPELIKANASKTQLGLDAQSSSAPDQPEKALVVFRDKSTSIPHSQWVLLKPQTPSVLWFMLLAFFGGLLLNLMPCVFPVLFLKIQALVQRDERPSNGIAYTLGVCLTFFALNVLLLALTASGQALGWGFQFQSPAALAFMVVLFFLLALYMYGYFDLPLAWLQNSAAQKSRGDFLTGVLAVFVASPCTAPFMGAALGYASLQPVIIQILIFQALALGFASPFYLLPLLPKNYLPKIRPGAWMEHFKKFMAFPLLFTALWLTSVFLQVSGETQTLALLAGLIWIFLFIWSQKSFQSLLGRWGLPLVCGFAVYLFMAPQMTSRQSADRSKGSDRLYSWQTFEDKDYQALANQRQAPVFINFTAAWCLSCQVNDRLTFSDPQVQNYIKDNNILMVKADWTKPDELIAKTLKRFGRNGIPVYVVYQPKESSYKLLPEVITPRLFIDSF